MTNFLLKTAEQALVVLDISLRMKARLNAQNVRKESSSMN
jgi:hypothetical protein